MSLTALRRPVIGPVPSLPVQQTRHATLIRRPKRPYTFTQLITLSDGSTFTHRTTSPAPVYRVSKDTKNSVLWNPSSQKLLNIEEDEAGRLKRFRKRFGRGFDVEGAEEDGDGVERKETAENSGQEDSFLDLIAGYGADANAAGVKGQKKKSGKSKGGQK